METPGHALLVALPDPKLASAEAQRLMTSCLKAFGFSDIVCLPGEGQPLTRASVLDGLDALVARVGPNDPCVFHYFGHGDRVCFTDRSNDAVAEITEARVFSYLRCTRGPGGEFDDLLDLALTRRLSQLAHACGNLTTIIDACHSATVVRSAKPKRSHHSRPTPTWLLDELRACDDRWLAPESHPGVVRLAAAPPLTGAETIEFGRRNLGLLTKLLHDELMKIAEHRQIVSWDALVHRLRGAVFQTKKSEYQWIVLAGPRERRLFATETLPLPRSVGFVANDASAGWIWAGRLQGVETGDRWRTSEVEAIVVGEVELARARLSFTADRPPAIGSAELVRVAAPMLVELDADVRARLEPELARSAWLAPTTHAGAARVSIDHGEFVVADLDQRWSASRWPLDEHGTSAMIERLEDQARSRRLLGLVAPKRTGDAAIRVTWGRVRDDEAPARLHADEPIWIRIECSDASPDAWFVQVIHIDGLGRPRLLGASQPDGIAVERGEPQWIGARPGRRRAGVVLGWPESLSGSEVACSLLVIACGRPLQLGHLVRPHAGDDDMLAVGLRLGPERTGMRDKLAPQATKRGEVLRFDFQLVKE
ncbi:hypothetical protein ACNOYE_08490 [Nannocystaceae bacterium ST9]